MIDAGVVFELIDTQMLAATIAAMQKWMSTTREGASFLIDYMKLAAFRGQDDKVHYIVDEEGQVVDHVPPGDVWMVHGLVANGQFIPPGTLRVSEKDMSPCEGCGIMAHCLKNIELKSYCNFCLSNSENLRLRDEGSRTVCENCSVMACSHHPTREWRRARAF